ncbi:TatD family hydrolase [Alteribacillus sp. YIM 98480]|uniref:TatD family hydrolase n=1 Tax=Alteribacillus sp. YIM 98480 TaxID=2606599 RepID=UPI00131B0F09|nr:TatD family hydrolase [Alteribacillus sp. YIM 98480]
MIDAHIHLEQYENIESSIEKWKKAGIQKVVAVSNNLASSYKTLELKEKFSDFILAGVGFHPEKGLPKEADFQEWQRLVYQERDKIACIGEIGLPHYELEQLPTSIEQHINFLNRCLHTAKDHMLPVALHAVHDKAEIVYQLLQQETPHLPAHFHWLKAQPEVVRQITASGYYISLTPEVCYRHRDQMLASMIPTEQVLIETDGPWPFEGPFKEKQTTPLFLSNIVSFLAKERNKNKQAIEKTIVHNTLKMYG